ncbi:MAG: FRG domain-containing protein [Muribaculaceae bacterium]
MDLNPDDIHVTTIVSLPPIMAGGFLVPQNADIDPATTTITLSEAFLSARSAQNSLTPLRFEVYASVRKLYLILHPEKLGDLDYVMASIYYADSIILLKGLQIPLPDVFVHDACPQMVRILKEEFNLEAKIVKTPAPTYKGASFYCAQLSEASKKRYIQRYMPSYSKSYAPKLAAGDKGTKENPFNNIYEAVEYIRQMEIKAHDQDMLLKDIEQQKYFYDVNFDCFRIHWASPYVSQYTNQFPARTFFVNQMAPLPGCPLNEQWFSFKPNLYGHKFLYRGQSDHYEGKPCVPNLFRDEKKNANRDYIEFMIFAQELELLIKTHPLVQLFDKGIELLHDTFRFRVHYSGLAQHYYNKSRLLDLSSDLEVMKFFATTDYCWKTDTYYPCKDTSKLGVIYCYELIYPNAFQQHKGYALKTIGKQIFMRPGSQCGYLLDMEKDVDLKKLPEVTALYFRHDAKISQEIFDQSNNGEEYFADDLLQYAWKDRFRARRDRKVVSRKAAELNASRNKATLEDTISKLNSIGITVDDYEPAFTEDELNIYYNSIKNGWWEEFCDDIHFYGAEDELYRQAMKDLPQKPEYSKYFTK